MQDFYVLNPGAASIEVKLMSTRETLRDFMSPQQRHAVGSLPTTHRNCKEATGVYRPGKTARDRARAR